MNSKSLKVITGLVAVFISLAGTAANAQSSGSQPKTRAEVIAEMQAERAAGRLYQPDYYPVFTGSWPVRRDVESATAATTETSKTDAQSKN